MHTARYLPYKGVSVRGSLPDSDPLDRDSPGQRPPLAARQEVTSYRDPSVNRMSHICKNITLPQTSFADGN